MMRTPRQGLRISRSHFFALVLGAGFWVRSGAALAGDDVKLKAELSSGAAVLIDVRELGEWNDGHLKNALHVPLSDLQSGRIGAVPQGKAIYLYCKSGRRAGIAATILKDRSFPNVTPLSDGYEVLKQRGF